MIDLTAARNMADAADKTAQGATEGPWKWETVRTSCGVCHKIGPWPHKWRHGQETSACIYDDYPSPAEGTDTMLANARFIAASRQLVPDMAATIRALCAEVERLREAFRVNMLRYGPTGLTHEAINRIIDGQEQPK